MKNGIDVPLFIGIDTHALSRPALESALEVFAANGVDAMLAADDEFTPTPLICCHAQMIATFIGVARLLAMRKAPM